MRSAGREVTSEAGVAERVLAGQRARLTQRLKADRTLEDVLVDRIAQLFEPLHYSSLRNTEDENIMFKIFLLIF